MGKGLLYWKVSPIILVLTVPPLMMLVFGLTFFGDKIILLQVDSPKMSCSFCTKPYGLS
jgi:hypothetical protein